VTREFGTKAALSLRASWALAPVTVNMVGSPPGLTCPGGAVELGGLLHGDGRRKRATPRMEARWIGYGGLETSDGSSCQTWPEDLSEGKGEPCRRRACLKSSTSSRIHGF